MIRNRGPRQVSELLKEGYSIDLTDVRCVETPPPPKPKPEELEEQEPEHVDSSDS